jgi:hypothetical protein
LFFLLGSTNGPLSLSDEIKHPLHPQLLRSLVRTLSLYIQVCRV